MAKEDPLCLQCGEPIDLTGRYVAVTRQVETRRRRAVIVHDAEVLAYLHEDHSDGVRVAIGR